jgi:hypothetical protein
MTSKTLKTLSAGIVAATIATTALIAPAAAGGSISFSVAPQNQEEADLMRAGMQIYSLIKGAKNGHINQHGYNNSAGLGQYGYGNTGIVHQEGSGHSGTVQQHGNDNAYGLFQFGKNTSADVSQHGHGQTGATFQFGWD